MTVAEAIRLGTRFLGGRRLRSPRLDTELLLTTILEKTRTFLFAYPETVLTEVQQAKFREWLRKCGQHYPIQYLVGKQEFYGHEFLVTPSVLIPRPETELLVDTCLDLLRHQPRAKLHVLDIGTGSGCLAISLGLADSRLQVTATDVSATALEVARENSRRLQCTRQITFCHTDLLPPVTTERSPQLYDLVVSNPPYVDPAEIETVDSSVRLFEPSCAVFAEEGGLAVYKKLFREIPAALREPGFLVVELGQKPNETIALSRTHSWRLHRIHKDLAGVPRCAVFVLPSRGCDSDRQTSEPFAIL